MSAHNAFRSDAEWVRGAREYGTRAPSEFCGPTDAHDHDLWKSYCGLIEQELLMLLDLEALQRQLAIIREEQERVVAEMWPRPQQAGVDS